MDGIAKSTPLLIFYIGPSLLNPIILFLFATALTLVVAIASWNFIENPALKLTKKKKAALVEKSPKRKKHLRQVLVLANNLMNEMPPSQQYKVKKEMIRREVATRF